MTVAFVRRDGTAVPSEDVLAALATLAEHTGTPALGDPPDGVDPVTLCAVTAQMWEETHEGVVSASLTCLLPHDGSENLHVDPALGVWDARDHDTYDPDYVDPPAGDDPWA